MASKLPLSGYILGLDVGDKRIGTALASVIAQLPQPAGVISSEGPVYDHIKNLAKQEDVNLVVIGIPRNLAGEETAQSQKIREFAAGLAENIDIPIEFADESLSSKRADQLAHDTQLQNVSQDSLAACFILEEFLGSIDSMDGESS